MISILESSLMVFSKDLNYFLRIFSVLTNYLNYSELFGILVFMSLGLA